MRNRVRPMPLALLLAGALLGGCGGDADAPEVAEPSAGIAPDPTDSTFVPGAGQPGPQERDPGQAPE